MENYRITSQLEGLISMKNTIKKSTFRRVTESFKYKFLCFTPPKEQAETLRVQRHFDRLNFEAGAAHKLLRAATGAGWIYDTYGVGKPNYRHLKYSPVFSAMQPDIWSDSVILRFGQRPVAHERFSGKQQHNSALLELPASLVISQSIHGDVVALLYPPKTDVSGTEKDCYIVKRWTNPSKIKVTQLVKLIEMTVRANVFLSALLPINKKGNSLLADLTAIDKKLAKPLVRWQDKLKKAPALIGGIVRLVKSVAGT